MRHGLSLVHAEPKPGNCTPTYELHSGARVPLSFDRTPRSVSGSSSLYDRMERSLLWRRTDSGTTSCHELFFRASTAPQPCVWARRDWGGRVRRRDNQTLLFQHFASLLAAEESRRPAPGNLPAACGSLRNGTPVLSAAAPRLSVTGGPSLLFCYRDYDNIPSPNAEIYH